jgi:hypothetical protein
MNTATEVDAYAWHRQARALLDPIMRNPEMWSPARQMVANVFNAYPTRAYTAEKIIAITKAAESCSPEGDEYILDALKFLVRKKALRSYVKQGARLYEVAFTD